MVLLTCADPRLMQAMLDNEDDTAMFKDMVPNRSRENLIKCPSTMFTGLCMSCKSTAGCMFRQVDAHSVSYMHQVSALGYIQPQERAVHPHEVQLQEGTTCCWV